MNADFTYTLYSAENAMIKIDDTVKISTGMLISIPIKYFPWVFDDTLDASRNIKVSMNSSLTINPETDENDHENSRATEFIVQLTNYGCSDYKIKIGDPICKMVLLKTGRLLCEQVETFKRTIIIEQPNTVKTNNSGIPKTTMLWFKRMYKSNPYMTSTKFLSENQRESLQLFKLSEKYINARLKINVEVNYVWETLLDDDAKKLIYED